MGQLLLSLFTSFSYLFFFLLFKLNPVNNVYLNQNLNSAMYKVNVCIAK